MESIHILLVEDNEGDILLTQEAFEESKILNLLSVVRDGREALNFVFQKNGYEQAKRPDLILLDINLPIKNGHEVLQAIKESPEHRSIPIIMLTTSSSERDISLSYKCHANCYISKPVDINEFLAAIASIENFWLNLVQLPPKVI